MSAEAMIRTHSLCTRGYSPFFDAAFNGPLLEGERKAINMDECSPAGFALFINWMYSPSHGIKLDKSLSSKKATEALVELWLLADRCLISGLQNQVLVVLDQVRERTRYRIASSSAVIYENTSDDSPLRHYLVQVIATSATIEDMGTMAGMPWEMLVDIIALLKAGRGYRRWAHFTPQQLRQFFVKERKVSLLTSCCGLQLILY